MLCILPELRVSCAYVNQGLFGFKELKNKSGQKEKNFLKYGVSMDPRERNVAGSRESLDVGAEKLLGANRPSLDLKLHGLVSPFSYK